MKKLYSIAGCNGAPQGVMKIPLKDCTNTII